jgi:hypothetical protein
MVADQKGVSRTRFNSKYVGSVRGGTSGAAMSRRDVISLYVLYTL